MKNNDHSSKIRTTIIITVIVVIYYVVYFVFLMKELPGIAKILFGIVPLILAYGMVKVCIERINEIKGGEEDDISKY